MSDTPETVDEEREAKLAALYDKLPPTLMEALQTGRIKASDVPPNIAAHIKSLEDTSRLSFSQERALHTEACSLAGELALRLLAEAGIQHEPTAPIEPTRI